MMLEKLTAFETLPQELILGMLDRVRMTED